MKVIKKINNNAAVCLDSQNHEMIAIGTGIGFPSVPYELDDLSIVQKTYYDVSFMHIELLNQISEKIFDISYKIVDMYRSSVKVAISSNLVFTLADHINFAIERTEKNISISTPLQYDIQHLYENEYMIGLKGIKMIQQELEIKLPRCEATNIALHLINANNNSTILKNDFNVDVIIDDITDIVGKEFQIYIQKDSFNYSRFVTHLQYLIKRIQQGEIFKSDNLKLYGKMKSDYSKAYKCVCIIKTYLKEELNYELNEEESLYLILHINRLCIREDCYREGITPISNDK